MCIFVCLIPMYVACVGLYACVNIRVCVYAFWLSACYKCLCTCDSGNLCILYSVCEHAV